MTLTSPQTPTGGPAPSAAADPGFGHRRGTRELTLLGLDGEPLREAEVMVEQRSHAFAFGCIGFDFIPHANGEVPAAGEQPRSGSFGGAAPHGTAEALAALWFDVFNAATLPFYWGDFEPVRGEPDTHRLLTTARWFAERGARLKGHPLAWHTQSAPWLLDLTTEEVLEAQWDRSARETRDFAGVIDTWDAINEAVIMPVYDKYDNGLTRVAQRLGRVDTVRTAFDAARSGNPAATLIINDFNTSPEYEELIEQCLEAGVRIDAIGVQSHMHKGYWGEERTLEVLGRFARFGLPLHLSENTLVSGELMPATVGDLNDHQVDSWPSTPEGEARQADELQRHYRTLLSHPAVASVTYWGISDAASWLKAPVGLVRADGTTKPSYDALRDLVKDEWWTPAHRVRTDDAGRLRLEGWWGGYRVTSGGAQADVEHGPAAAGAEDSTLRLAAPPATGA